MTIKEKKQQVNSLPAEMKLEEAAAAAAAAAADCLCAVTASSRSV
jgi:hypothetical protein